MTAEGHFKFSETLEANFREILREVKDNRKPIDALLEHAESRRKRSLICRALTRNESSADDLRQMVDLKVWRKFMKCFTPDYDKRYGNFFAWYRMLARRTYLNQLRKFDLLRESDSVEENLSIRDLRLNVEEELSRRSRDEEIWNHVKSLPREHRLAARLILKGRSSRRAAEVLNRLGIECCHATVLNWIKKDFKPLFPAGISSFKKVS
jgi:DNA-directed RNA polymerase specialized sigma24 family protein